jgi:hypothetical protein
MKFLTQLITPNLTFTRTKRKCIVNEMADLVTLYESTVKIEISLPSMWQGLKDKVERIATDYLINLWSDNLIMNTA